MKDDMNINLIEKWIKDLNIYILVGAVLFFSGDSAIGANYKTARDIMIVVLFGLTLLYLLLKCHTISINTLRVLMISILCVMLSGLVNLELSGMSLILVMGIAFFFSQSISFFRFMSVYDNWMFIITIASVIGIALQVFFPASIEVFPELWVGGSWARNLYITVIPTGYDVSTIRCYGIFREPAMYSFYLGLALLINLLYVEKKKYWRILIYLVALLLSKSITGYIACAYLFFVYVFFINKNLKVKRLGLCAIPLAVIGLYVSGLLDYILYRFQRTGGSQHSINSRIASITVNFYTWATHPIFGAGAINSQQEFLNNLTKLGYASNLTSANMVMYLLSSFGFIFALLFLIGIYGFSKAALGSRKKCMLVLIFFCILFCGETLTYSSMPYIIMFYGWVNINYTKSMSKLWNIEEQNVEMSRDRCTG